MERVFVPLVTVNIQPQKNDNQPAIEGTTRSTQCPRYEIALIKKKWGVLAENITVTDMIDGVDPLYELLPRFGKGVYESEEKRLTMKYGEEVFNAVYRGDELKREITECAKDSNAFLEEARQANEDRAVKAGQKAAAALIQESTKAVAEAMKKAEPRGPGRPRKEPVSV